MFYNQPTSKDAYKEWTRSVRREIRSIDRQIRKTQHSERKLVAELKKEAKYIHQDFRRYRALRYIAKAISKCRNQCVSLINIKSKLHSVVLELKEHRDSAYPEVKVKLNVEKQRILVRGWIREEAVTEFPTDIIGICLQYYIIEMHGTPCRKLSNLLNY